MRPTKQKQNLTAYYFIISLCLTVSLAETHYLIPLALNLVNAARLAIKYEVSELAVGNDDIEI